MTWQEEHDLSVRVLNALSLPQPENGEDAWDYMDRVEQQFSGIDLPPEMEGELFNFMSMEEFCDYLHEYRNIHVQEDIHYRLWPRD